MNRRTSALTGRWLLLFGLGLLAALLGVLQPRAASAAGCVVNNTNDSGAGSLREKLADSSCSAITFQAGVTGTIALDSDLPPVTRTVNVTGPGAASLIVDRRDTSWGYVFPVAPSGNLTLRGLTVTGASQGVRLDGGGAVTLESSNVSGNDDGVFVRYSGTVTVNNSTFSNNRQSAISIRYNPGPIATVSNSTFSGNYTGLYAAGGSATVTSSTFSNGSQSVVLSGGNATLTNTLLATGGGNANCFVGFGSSLTNSGRNLADDATCFADGANGSRVVAVGQTGVAPLGSYGGPTQTQALLPGSPAIDAGNPAVCAAAPVSGIDQRGIDRTQGTACDIGAFESRGFDLAYTSGNNQSAPITTAFAGPLVATVSSAHGEPVAGGTVTFTGPGGGAGIAPSPLTATIAADGRASAGTTANATVGGPYTVTASAAGAAPNVTFSLTNTRVPTRLVADDANGTYSGTTTLRATLTATSGGTGVGGKTILFTLNGTQVCDNATGGYPAACPTTNGDGVAQLAGVSLGTLGATTHPAIVGASFAGDATHTASGDTADLAVGKATASITLDTPTLSQTYNGTPRAVTATTVPAGLGYSVTYDGGSTAPTGAGTYAVAATIIDPNYAGTATGSLVVAQAPSTTAVNAPDASYTGSPHAGASATATGAGGLNQPVTPLTFAGRNGTTYGPSTTPPTNAGDYTASASFAGDANHASSAGSADFTIRKASQGIAFLPNPLPNRAYGDAPFVVAATASSGQPVTFAAGPPNVCTVNAATVTIVGVGTCTVTASQAGNGNYQAAPDVPRAFQVAQATTTLAGVRGEATYGDATATLRATLTRGGPGGPPLSGQLVTFTLHGVTVGGAATDAQGVAILAAVPLPRGTAAGTARNAICASFAGDSATTPAGPTCGPLVVARRILWLKPADRSVGLRQPNPPTTPPANCLASATATRACWLELANGSTFVNGDDWGDLNLAQLRFTYNRNPPSTNASERVGTTYRITAFGVTNQNYDIRYLPGTLTVVAP
jgi:parallel beta-helix repeat protein